MSVTSRESVFLAVDSFIPTYYSKMEVFAIGRFVTFVCMARSQCRNDINCTDATYASGDSGVTTNDRTFILKVFVWRAHCPTAPRGPGPGRAAAVTLAGSGARARASREAGRLRLSWRGQQKTPSRVGAGG